MESVESGIFHIQINVDYAIKSKCAKMQKKASLKKGQSSLPDGGIESLQRHMMNVVALNKNPPSRDQIAAKYVQLYQIKEMWDGTALRPRNPGVPLNQHP